MSETIAAERQLRHAYVVLFTIALLVTMASPLRALVAFSLDGVNAAASQIVLVPFVSAFLVFLKRDVVFREIRYSVLPGVVVMTVGLALLVVASQIGTGLLTADYLALTTAAIVVTWLGGFLFFYGTRAFRAALFPLMFMVFCIPIPTFLLDKTIEVLRWGSAEMAYGIMKLSGTPVYREGYVFALPGLTIEVAPECSGIRSGIGMLMTGLLAGYLMLKTWTRQVALVVVAIPLLIFKNAIRIDTLSLLSVHVDPTIIEGRLHHEGGIVFFALGILMLYPVLLLLVRSEEKLTSTGAA